MPLITVTPVIGEVSKDRLDSLRGCHALHEHAVTRRIFRPDEIGAYVKDAIIEITLAEMARSQRKEPPSVTEFKYLVTIRD